MTASWIVANVWHYSLQVAAVVAAIGLALAMLRASEPGLRLRALRVALLFSLAVPLLSAWMSSSKHPPHKATGPLLGAAVTAGSTRGVDVGSALADAWQPVVAALILAGAAARLMWLVAGTWRWRSGRPVQAPPAIDAEVQRLQSALGTRALVEWRADLTSPSTTGVLPPRVLLPVALFITDPVRRRAVVCHELLHVRRGDWTHVVYEEAIRTLLWFHPAVRWLIGELRLAREQVVDREVVAFTRERRPYLDVLLSYADAAPPRAAGAVLPFFRRRQLERRIRSLILEVGMSRRHKIATVVTTLMLGAGASAVAGYSFPMVLAAPVQQQAGDSRTAGATTQTASSAETMPAVTSRTPIAYPAALADAPVDGRVTARLIIDDAGAVSSATIVGASVTSGTQGQDAKATADAVRAMSESALEALRTWKFEPPQASPLLFDITVSFRRPHGTGSEDSTLLAEPASGDKLAISVPSEQSGQASSGARARSSDAKPVAPGNGESQPKLIHEVPAAYPEEAKAARIQGTVELEVTISTDGKVSEARVVRSVPGLDRSALDAVRQWRFTPGLLNGTPVPVLVSLEVRFALK